MGDMTSPPIPQSKASEHLSKAVVSLERFPSTENSVTRTGPATEQSLPAQQTSAAETPHDANTPSSAQDRATFHMTRMADALPRGDYQNPPRPRGNHRQYNQQTSHQAMQSMPHNHFVGPQHGSMMIPSYYVHQPHTHQYYPANAGQQPLQERDNVSYYPMQYLMNHQQAPGYYQQPPQFHNQNHQRPEYMMNRHEYVHPLWRPQARRLPNRANRSHREQAAPPDISRSQNPLRGPPRRPHQGGHAVWIGNLPPQTDLMSLVRHICELAPLLQSVFLIAKSNCAFANFKEENESVEAQKTLHDSKFQSVRLVCRLRKTTAERASDNPIVIAAGTSSPTSPTIPRCIFEKSSSLNLDRLSPSERQISEKSVDRKGSETSGSRDRFFVLKSLTREDLELSVRTGVWATQSHNEELLNNAFKTADNVYLVFSANKSGEYFGFARMASEINQDPDAAIQFASHAHTTDESKSMKVITIEAKDNTPKGRVIDDSVRGTMFWEVEANVAEGNDEGESMHGKAETVSNKDAEDVDEEIQTSGRPFHLEWLSTVRLPFYRTRGLRNPWNSNREVKIARDGTELEPSVALRLLGLLNHNSNTISAARFVDDPRGAPQIR